MAQKRKVRIGRLTTEDKSRQSWDVLYRHARWARYQ